MSTDEPSSSGLYCDACSAHIPNETTYQQHLKGRKHTRNIERIKEWSDTAKRSVYVSGLKSVVAAELAIADFFGQFGNVKNVTIDKTNKQYAIVELECEETVQSVLALENPAIGGNPITIKPREFKDHKPQTKKERSNQKIIVIDEKLWQKLLDVQNVNEQLLLLYEEVKLSGEEIHIRNLICKLLQSALHEAFPNCVLKPYGSSVNGFGMHGCDLDLHFEHSEIHPDILHEIQVHRKENSDGKEMEMLEYKATCQEIVAAVGEVIKQCVPDCHKIKVICQTRFPLVRFRHMGSHVRCDLSLSNELALVNTKYLQLCCDVFPLLKPLVIVVRAWMKHWELAGGIHVNGPRLNNYAVTLIVLFFLQNSGKLSSLSKMTSHVPITERVSVNGWDCTLVEAHLVPKVTDHSLPGLLADFFQFYAKVDFSKTVLDTRSASYESFTPNGFGVFNNGDGGARKFRLGALNIQDPFELSHNVAGNVTERHMQNFYRHMHNAALVVKMRRYQHKSMYSNTWGLLELFIDHHRKRDDQETAAPEPGKGNAYSFDVKLNPAGSEKSEYYQKAAGYFVTILRDVFAMDCSVESEPESLHLDDGNEAVDSSVAVQTFPTQHSCDVSGPELAGGRKRPAEDDDCAFCKRAKVAINSSDVRTSSVQLPCRIQCEARQRLWQGRRKARRRLVQKGLADFLDLERKVSQLLLADLDKKDPSAPEQQLNTSSSSIDSNAPPLFCFTTGVCVADDGALRLQFRCTSDDGHNDYVNFLHHLEMFLPNLLKKCLAQMPHA